MEYAFRQDMSWYFVMGVFSVVGSVWALCKLKAFAISRRCCRFIASSPPSVMQLLQDAMPDHEFFEEERGIWVSGPTFGWATAADGVWMQRDAHDRWGRDRPYPWTLLDFDEESDANQLPRRRIVTPSVAPWTRTPVAATGLQTPSVAATSLQTPSIAANGWVDHFDLTPVAANDDVWPSIAADGWVDDSVVDLGAGSPSWNYQELPSGDAQDGLGDAQGGRWEPPLESYEGDAPLELF